ncbi:hypothetical protein ACROYT_G035617, partial [Oculina patagonica]
APYESGALKWQLTSIKQNEGLNLQERAMTNPVCFAIAILLLSHVTWANWAQWGVTCEPEAEMIKICGGDDFTVTKCRGTCKSMSKITMNFPFYKTECQCCKSTGWRDEVISCADGSTKKVSHATGCTCQTCHGA